MEEILYTNSILLALIAFSIFFMLRKYGIRAFVHPFMVFLFMWTLTCLSIFIYSNNSGLFPSPADATELLYFVIFNIASIWISMLLIPVKAKESEIRINIPTNLMVYKVVCIICCTISLINISSLSSNSFQANRFAGVERSLELIGGAQATIYESISNILMGLLIPLCVLSGKPIINYLTGYDKKKLSLYFLIPTILIVVNTIVGGSRAGIASIILLLILCVLLQYNYQGSKKKIWRRGIVWIISILTLFSIYSTIVSAERSKFTSQDSSATYTINGLFSPAEGVISYSFFHIQGYQLRKNDRYTKDPEIFGPSLAIITDFSIPFSSMLGGDKYTFGKLFGIERRKYKYDDTLAAHSITASVYFNLIDDFGYTGTFIAIILFTLYTQLLYKKLFNKSYTSLTSLAWYFFIFKLWQSSYFNHVLSSITIFSIFVPFLLTDLLQKINTSKRDLK